MLVRPAALAPGDRFQLFVSGAYMGSFTSLTLPPLGPGLGWTNKLLVDGSIEVVPSSAPKISGLAVSGTNLVFNVIDGLPGPATEEALLSYQRSLRLPLTGRLDLETLSNLRLLPGRPPMPVRGTVRMPSNGPRVYRGIIVR